MRRVLIVDDHAVVRGGVKNIVDRPPGTVDCGEASTAKQAIELVETEQWDLVILDISLGPTGGLEALQQIKKLRPALPVLMLTMHPERQFARRCFRTGASGYVTKDSATAELRQAVDKVLAGGRYVSQHLAEALILDLGAGEVRPPHERLSSREFQVMRLIGSGKTVREIAALLALSDHTVSTYRTRVLDKMKMGTNAELVHYALQNDLAD